MRRVALRSGAEEFTTRVHTRITACEVQSTLHEEKSQDLLAVAARHSRPPPRSVKNARKPKVRNKQSDDARMEAAREFARGAIKEGLHTFDDVDPYLFVALFVEVHAVVYKVEPLELTIGNKAGAATKMAAKMLGELPFLNSGAEFANYIRWVFVREEKRMKKDPAKTMERRVSFMNLFQPSWLLTDYIGSVGPR